MKNYKLFHQKNIIKNDKSYYQILGVGQKAKNEEIKKAFYKLAKLYHPDCNIYLK
jgi:molecular chaperone DnaJ